VTAVAWVYFKKRARIDLAALALASTIPDVEPLIAIFAGSETHVLFHSFLGAVLLSPLLAIFVWTLERRAKRVVGFGYRFLRLRNPGEYGLRAVLLSCMLGWLSHVFFDMWTHETFRFVLFPIVGENPFWFDYPIVQVVESVVLGLSAYSVLLWVRQVGGGSSAV
jgi:hypothetical protein